jgi:hypothetical protein
MVPKNLCIFLIKFRLLKKVTQNSYVNKILNFHKILSQIHAKPTLKLYKISDHLGPIGPEILVVS